MKEYYIRTLDEKYNGIIKAENGKKAIEHFKQLHNLKRYRKFIVIESRYLFN